MMGPQAHRSQTNLRCAYLGAIGAASTSKRIGLIGRNLGLSKNTVMEIIRRAAA
jgi:hypothetical protein